MEEKAHLGARSCLSQISRHAHEVIIVHPNEIFVRGSVGGSLGKFAIDPLIGFPIIGIELAERRHIVKQGPDDLVGKSGVEFCDLFLRERNGLQSMKAPPRSFRQQMLNFWTLRRARPTDPYAGLMTPGSIQSGGQSSGTALYPGATGSISNEYGQPVGNVDQASFNERHNSSPEHRAIPGKTGSAPAVVAATHQPQSAVIANGPGRSALFP